MSIMDNYIFRNIPYLNVIELSTVRNELKLIQICGENG